MSLKNFLFPAANILLSIFLLIVFWKAGRGILETYPIAQQSALGHLQPQPLTYMWDMNINNAAIDTNMINEYKDYYSYLLKIDPSQKDAYTILGYCYHYLGNDTKAIAYFKKAILNNPDYSWNYYDLMIIYFTQSRFEECYVMLKNLQQVNPQKSLRVMFTSQEIFLPLLGAGDKDAMLNSIAHLKLSYTISSFIMHELIKVKSGGQLESSVTNMKLNIYVF
jgi:tetratricopeptide (TPR) repeat protein